jgi:cobalt/nickel transport system permease protein
MAMIPILSPAMHIADGQLPAPWCLVWWLAAIPFVYIGLRSIDRRRASDPQYMAMVALVGSAIFVISCMPIPVPSAHTCSHPCGTGLGALLIGPGPTVVVASIALVLQALFLAHGGLTTLGANIITMGVVGAFTAYGLFRLFRLLRMTTVVAAFAAGVVSDWATYAMTSFVLSSAIHAGMDQSLWGTFAMLSLLLVPTQLPIGIAEGFLTAGAYRFVLARRPELLAGAGRGKLPAIEPAGDRA